MSSWSWGSVIESMTEYLEGQSQAALAELL